MFSIKCFFHEYVNLYYDGKFIFCYDNSTYTAEAIIINVQRRTCMKFRDIPVIGDRESFQGLRFKNGGWLRSFWDDFPSDDELYAYERLKG